MKFLLIGLCLLCLTASAQRDSSRLDIGWMSLDRNLTQTITVKGSDLEKMPFMNLAEALRAWFFGAYTGPESMAYVVDGNPVTDVNIYPIYEIEEVTLVENAIGAAAYGSGQQWLAVVTTKRDKEKRGFRVVGQAGLVNGHGNGLHTTTNVYHQYYAGMYQRLDKVEYGLSANWIRDVSPIPSGNLSPVNSYHVTTPLELQRWRFNGYLRWQPAKGQMVELGMGYAPERLDQNSDSTVGSSTFYGTNRRLRGHLAIPQLSWRGELFPGLREELQVVYVSSSVNASAHYVDSNIGNPQNSYYPGSLAEQKVSQVFIRERLGYSMQAGAWVVRPAVNLSYDHIDEKSATGSSTYIFVPNGLPVITPPVMGPEQEMKGDLLYITPSVDVGFGRAIDLQGGVQVNLKNGEDAVSKSVFPFATLGVDVLKFGKGVGSSLKLFGSYAQRAQGFVDDYSLFDLSGGGGGHTLADVYRAKYTRQAITTYVGAVNNPVVTTTTLNIPLHYPATLWSWQAGIGFALPGDKFRVSYAFEQRNYNTPHYFAFISNTVEHSYAYVPTWKSDLHHLDIRLKVTGDKYLRWETGLGVTALRSKSVARLPDSVWFPTVFTVYISYPQGELGSDKLSWTGGWTNRLQVGAFEAGLDILFHFGEHPYSGNRYGGYVAGPGLNSVMTPNVFVGYQWKLRGAKTLGVFLASRGLARSKSSDLPDDRRYYTLGGSLGL